MSSTVFRRAAALFVGLCFFAELCQANGFGENAPYQFRSAADRAARVAQLNLQEAKKGGLFERSNGSSSSGGGTSQVINGDQINCNLLSEATGNLAQNTSTSSSGAITGITENVIDSAAIGSDAENTSSGDGQVSNTQDNTGQQTSSTDGTTYSTGSVSENDGGQSSSPLDSSQSNDASPTSSSVLDSSACGDFVLN